MQERVLTALENAGVFTTGGLVKEKVMSVRHLLFICYNLWIELIKMSTLLCMC